MKNTKISVLFICLLMGFGLQAQTPEEAIRKDVSTYFQLLQEQKISEALDWVHPDLIGMFGKELFLDQYKEMLEKASFGDLDIKSVSPVFSTEAKGDYALLNYNFKMNYDVADMEDQQKQIMLNVMKSQFGEATLKGNIVEVSSAKEMFAVSKPEYQGWRILDYEKGMKVFLATIIPEEVFTHFKK